MYELETWKSDIMEEHPKEFSQPPTETQIQSAILVNEFMHLHVLTV